ncbi:hypothetical protein K3718_21725 (plasmid) [Leisingera aquaemixtae]|uniref:DUF2892 domain-containing protein n=1 Tax=Leisingera aquaemixtae TaxID=1396826 RepID=A0ABY5WR10_9RHOB|nr:hypothetical protein [Leisingera aquaemixtae]UWQ43983.1 hypothetical protein K3718_21725 [Leisingera aquaemixtae]
MPDTPDLTNPTRSPGFRLPLGRRGLVIAALAVLGAGMALNWGWLTAIGAAPLILSLAPCAVMCAAGYCVMCKSKDCDARKTPRDAASGWSD